MNREYIRLLQELVSDGDLRRLLTDEEGVPRLLLTVEQAGRITSIPKTTLYSWIDAGTFPAITIGEGNHKRVVVDELLEWIASRKSERDERVRLARQGKRGWPAMARRKVG